MTQDTGKWILVIGLVIMLVGLLVMAFGDKLHWIGRLPGDIRIENENSRIYIPITTMILLSILLSVVMWIIRWWGK